MSNRTMIYKYVAFSLVMIAIFGLVIVTTYFSYQPKMTPIIHKTDEPDAWMENISAVIMDKQGKPSMKLDTVKMVHYSLNDKTDLTTPHLTLYRKSPQPWYINAKFAVATQGIENITFWNDVTIQHAADGSNPATLIKTSKLLVHPNQQTAETNDTITLLQPNLVVKAVGMRADMNTGNIKLLSDARGEYVPNS